MMLWIAAAAALLLQEKKDPGFATTKEAMQKIQVVVGTWRCTGSPDDPDEPAWIEKAEWGFKIERDRYSLTLAVTDGRLLREAAVSYDLKRKVYVLGATKPTGAKATYEGRLEGRKLILEEIVPPDRKEGEQERLTFDLLRDNRYLMSVERRRLGAKSWSSAYTVGCTKEGVPFVRGEAPKCVMTGGAGTIAVTHDGKTYYVC